MSTLLEELTTLKTAEDKITGNKVANFAYDDYAYEHDDANGVDTYNVNNHQNIPNGTASILKVNPTILTKGWRAQASAITRMLIDHFLGRCSYNLNKVNDHFSSLLTKLMSYLGEPNGIATLDEGGKVPATQIPKNDVAENTSNKVFTAKGAYDYFGGITNAKAWLIKSFKWVLGNYWRPSDYTGNIVSVSYYANGIWVAGSTGSGLWWSEDGKTWAQGTGASSTDTYESVYYANGIWVAGSVGSGLWWSEDGKAWTQGTGASSTDTFKYLHYANDIWVAGSTSIWWSTDGKAWTQGTGATDEYSIGEFCYANGIWVAGSKRSRLWWSTDGKAWTQTEGMYDGYEFSIICFGNGIWLAGCPNGRQGVWYSTNGKNWTSISTFANRSVGKIAFNNGYFAVSASAPAQTTVTYGIYYVLANNETDIQSNWHRSDVQTDLFNIYCLNGLWIAINARDGTVSKPYMLLSGDAKSWHTSFEYPSTYIEDYFYGVSYGNDTLLMYGMRGIWYSDYSIALED